VGREKRLSELLAAHDALEQQSDIRRTAFETALQNLQKEIAKGRLFEQQCRGIRAQIADIDRARAENLPGLWSIADTLRFGNYLQSLSGIFNTHFGKVPVSTIQSSVTVIDTII